MTQAPATDGIVHMSAEERRQLEESLAEGLAPLDLSADQKVTLESRLAELEAGGQFVPWPVTQEGLDRPAEEAQATTVEMADAAQADLDTLRKAFDAEHEGLGETFLGQIDQELGRIRQNPMVADFVGEGLLRVGLVSFPYSIVYRLQEGNVQVVAVMRHTSRMDAESPHP